jgi:hypothetical protein
MIEVKFYYIKLLNLKKKKIILNIIKFRNIFEVLKLFLN